MANDNGPYHKLSEYTGFFFGESRAAQAVLPGTNWWLVSLCLGFISALTHLILIHNPSICYLFARDQVRGFEVTLPEAMAAVNAWGWFNLILYPLQFTLVLNGIARFACGVARRLKGSQNYRVYFGMVTGGALIVTLGGITGYLMVNTQDLRNLTDLRDLTPGVGLGLLPLLAIERIGPFYREVIRGFDLFGIWVIIFLARVWGSVEGFSKLKSFWLAGVFYSLFIAVRWVVEGPGKELWHYFWNYGKV